MYYNKTHTDTNMEEIMGGIDKSKALDTALAQIENNSEKVPLCVLVKKMPLQVKQFRQALSFRPCPWHRRFCEGQNCRNIRT